MGKCSETKFMIILTWIKYEIGDHQLSVVSNKESLNDVSPHVLLRFYWSFRGNLTEFSIFLSNNRNTQNKGSFLQEVV